MPPPSVGGPLGAVLGELAQATSSGAVLGPIWLEVVGAATARHARPVSLRGGVLQVAVDAKAWAEELNRHRGRVIGQLAAALGPGIVRDLTFDVA